MVNRVVNFTANYNPQGNSYLALYGFTSNPRVEFYVVEAFAQHNPSDNAAHSFYGYHNSDGAQYELWSKYNGNLRQYFAVRRTNRYVLSGPFLFSLGGTNRVPDAGALLPLTTIIEPG